MKNKSPTFCFTFLANLSTADGEQLVSCMQPSGQGTHYLPSFVLNLWVAQVPQEPHKMQDLRHARPGFISHAHQVHGVRQDGFQLQACPWFTAFILLKRIRLSACALRSNTCVPVKTRILVSCPLQSCQVRYLRKGGQELPPHQVQHMRQGGPELVAQAHHVRHMRTRGRQVPPHQVPHLWHRRRAQRAPPLDAHKPADRVSRPTGTDTAPGRSNAHLLSQILV